MFYLLIHLKNVIYNDDCLYSIASFLHLFDLLNNIL
jgi:hypothetical protein